VGASKEVEGAPTPRGRGRPRREEARRAILDATIALLAERGFRATTMDGIAERAEVGKNSIYRRWCSKEELITDALDQLTAAPLEFNEGEDIRAVLLERIRDLVRVFGDPVVGQILPDVLGELQRNRAFALTFADRILRPRRAAVNQLIAKARAEGVLGSGGEVDLIADLLVGPPFLRMLFPIGLPELDERYAEQLLETIWRGIAP
jgi:AcrR family transcriptional regulator